MLAAAREALGGEKKLAAVKTIVATGRTRQVRGDNLVPIEFEIAIELPDKYVRKDEIPAQESGPTISGFNGDELLQFPAPGAAARARRRTAPADGRADGGGRAGRGSPTVKQDFARLRSACSPASSAAYPLTFTYVGKAEAPQGKADVLDVKGPPGPGAFAARLFINADTHLPIMITWTAPAPPMRGGPPRGRRACGAASPPRAAARSRPTIAARDHVSTSASTAR